MKMFETAFHVLGVMLNPLRTLRELDEARAQADMAAEVTANLMEDSMGNEEHLSSLRQDLSRSMQQMRTLSKDFTDFRERAQGNLSRLSAISAAKDDVIDYMQDRLVKIADCELPGSSGTARKMARLARGAYTPEQDVKCAA